ncbi:hemerythrin domain-containing protein [Salinisphaera sp. T31B1]|uniref:hemerythrin domain-containing protein n=1 Tax=Salinisphaera sp. T31B1 TaxID=727963 RepID=UPI00333FAF18
MTAADIPPGLRLPDRQGLPSTVAFLRATHPPSSWRSHRDFGELAAFWLDIHAGLRAQGRALAKLTTDFREGGLDTAGFTRQFGPRLNDYLAHLEGHHRIEDKHYFPRFRQLDTRMIRGFDLLENDHEIIHASVVMTVDRARALVVELNRGADMAQRAADAYADASDRLLRLLERHLADEEELVVPAILEHTERPVL